MMLPVPLKPSARGIISQRGEREEDIREENNIDVAGFREMFVKMGGLKLVDNYV